MPLPNPLDVADVRLRNQQLTAQVTTLRGMLTEEIVARRIAEHHAAELADIVTDLREQLGVRA